MITFFILMRPIIAGSGRDMRTILWPIRNLIRICGWRLDRLVDPIKIRFTGSPTLRPRTCGRPVVFQQLGVHGLAATHGSAHRKIRPPISGVCTTQNGECTTKGEGCTMVCTTKSGAWPASWVMNMASQSGDTCAPPPFWPYNNQPPPPSPALPLC